MRVGLISISIIFIIPFSLYSKPNWQTVGFCLLFLFLLVFNLIKLSRLKEISIQQNKLKIIHLFKFKSETYTFQDISEISKSVVVKETREGPNFIDFPSFELLVKTSNGKNYTFNSRENLNIDEMYNKLKKINTSS